MQAAINMGNFDINHVKVILATSVTATTMTGGTASMLSAADVDGMASLSADNFGR